MSATERRRAGSSRPVSNEVENMWSRTAAALSALSIVISDTKNMENIGRVNRLISAWPQDDTVPAEGLEAAKSIFRKLTSCLDDIAKMSDNEIKAIDHALELLSILIALKDAPQSPLTERRNKRPKRESSPAVSVVGPSNGRGVSITLPPRGSTGPPQLIPFSREPKARREALAAQLPLQEHRKVAFHPPATKPSSQGDHDDNQWMLAVIVRCLHGDKNRYEVQDAEPQDNGAPGTRYNTTLRSIIPLPDPNAPPGSVSSLEASPIFAPGSTVMALYPDTSCFYQAEVISAPNDMLSERKPTYKLKFEDDDDQQHLVQAEYVVEWPVAEVFRITRSGIRGTTDRLVSGKKKQAAGYGGIGTQS